MFIAHFSDIVIYQLCHSDINFPSMFNTKIFRALLHLRFSSSQRLPREVLIVYHSAIPTKASTFLLSRLLSSADSLDAQASRSPRHCYTVYFCRVLDWSESREVGAVLTTKDWHASRLDRPPSFDHQRLYVCAYNFLHGCSGLLPVEYPKPMGRSVFSWSTSMFSSSRSTQVLIT